MRKFFYTIVALLAVLSCMPENDWGPSAGMDPALEGQPVTITFSVPGVSLAPKTKAGEGQISEDNYLDAERLYLVVCGHSQSIKYIRKAEMVKDAQTGEPIVTPMPASEVPDFPLADKSGTVYLYTFKVQLELSDSDRTIHFLGNIDENQLNTGSYSYQMLPALLSDEDEQAYWQKVYLEAIHPQLDSNNKPVMSEGSYLPNAETQARLNYIPLIRNYAKVLVTDATDPSDGFELYSYAVICTPKRGSVVPYRSNVEGGDPFNFGVASAVDYRFSGYEKCDFQALETGLNYPGHLPAGVEFDEVIPEASMFETPENSDGRVIRYDKTKPDQGFYIYERGIPSENLKPTYVIIRGRFKGGEDDNFYYYRLDLMETKMVNYESVYQYYPIYRNFRYNIQINRISSVGVSTPQAAAKSSGAEDISADISMRYLADISNGQTRLVVEPYMAKTFTGPNEEGYYYLYARFFNDLNSPDPNVDWGAVSVELEPIEGSEDILILYDDVGNEVHSFYPTAQVMGGEPGFRIIRFNTKIPGSTTKTQRIKITGRNLYTHEEFPLYREVEITLQQKQNMVVTCSNPELVRQKGAKQEILVTIPTELPASMFPLEFLIEAELPTLTPDNGVSGNNLPVTSGISISDNDAYAGKTTIQFIRTLTWDEYEALTPSDGLCTFSSCFKSNRSLSATTVWVQNDYFNKASVSFTNTAELTGHFYVKADDEEACNVVLNNGNNLEYNFDETGWQPYKANQVIHLDRGYSVAFRSTKQITAWGGTTKFYCYKDGSNKTAKDGKFSIGGNLASLIMGDECFSEAASFTTSYSFLDFFNGHKNLTDAYELELPMLKCHTNCYKSFFDACRSLKRGPKVLPATQLADACYRNMFRDCVSLEEAPYIAAEKLATKCFQQMFLRCSSLSLIKINITQYSEGSFKASGEPIWADGVAPGGEIWMNPNIKTVKNFENIIPYNNDDDKRWTLKTLPDGEPWTY